MYRFDKLSILNLYSIDIVSIQCRYCIDTVSILHRYSIDTISILYRNCIATVSILYRYSIDTRLPASSFWSGLVWSGPVSGFRHRAKRKVGRIAGNKSSKIIQFGKNHKSRKIAGSITLYWPTMPLPRQPGRCEHKRRSQQCR